MNGSMAYFILRLPPHLPSPQRPSMPLLALAGFSVLAGLLPFSAPHEPSLALALLLPQEPSWLLALAPQEPSWLLALPPQAPSGAFWSAAAT